MKRTTAWFVASSLMVVPLSSALITGHVFLGSIGSGHRHTWYHRRTTPITMGTVRASLTTAFSSSSVVDSDPASSSFSLPSGSTVELVDPETNCPVVLLGCFHGSRSSASDVVKCLSQEEKRPTTTVIALELCATRFSDLRRDVLRDRDEARQSSPQSSTSKQPWLVRFASMVKKTSEKSGWSTGFVAAWLGGLSAIQIGLSGLEPGLEFRTALVHTMDAQIDHRLGTGNNNEDQNHSHTIVLVDQEVDNTLEGLGKLPSLALEMWKDVLFRGQSWKDTFGVEADALAQAIGLGHNNHMNDKKIEAVTLLGFVSRSSDAIWDLCRLLLPPMLGLQACVLATNFVFQQDLNSQNELMDSVAWAAMDQQLATTSSVEQTFGHLSSIFVLALGYVSVVLPAVRVVLRERDDVMTRGIQSACRLATQGVAANDTSDHCRVVAVVGLLHVNGIAERLMQQQQKEQQK